MTSQKTVTAIIIFFVSIMLGGMVGIVGGYYLDSFVEAEEKAIPQKEKMDVKDDRGELEIEEDKKEEKVFIDVSNLEDIENVLVIWEKIIEETAKESLTHKEAAKYIYSISSEAYRRNIPENFSLYRIEHIIHNNGKGHLKDIEFSPVIYEKENIVYVDVIEIYERDRWRYRLKFVKENSSWFFAAQLKG